jgi:hypothetical protein
MAEKYIGEHCEKKYSIVGLLGYNIKSIQREEIPPSM